jgi:uncharacterized membrane protein
MAEEVPEPQPVDHFASYRVTPPPQTSGIAVASLVCALFGLLVPIVPSLVGIVLGVIAFRQLRTSPPGMGKRYAIAAIVVGVLGIILMTTCLGVFVAPALRGARETTEQAKCAETLRNLGNVLLEIAAENKGQFPASLDAITRRRGVDGDGIRCPSHLDGPPYIYVGAGLMSTGPAETVLAYEPLGNHETAGMNVLFIDGRVQFIRKAEAAKAIKRLENGENPPWAN